MRCANCTESSEIAFTLTTYVEGGGEAVESDFCSIECLQDWTGTESRDLSEWEWGADEPAADAGEARDREGSVDRATPDGTTVETRG